ncbi:MAG: helix-turn-helix domain-containing protein [Bacteroidales bacterium]|nr:helix-turn-helix domain-containing protein [Bacteroidales bacterium]
MKKKEKDVATLLKSILSALNGQKEYLTINDAAAYCGVSVESIYRMLRENPCIVTCKPSRLKQMILRSSLDEYINKSAEDSINKIARDKMFIETVVKNGLRLN